ncbi:MAG: shikimate kinase [Actinomycetota bacterium]
MADTPNLVLTGFMGTGKTAVGRAAAAVLRADFVDTDAVIAARHGPIPEIFAERGESVFRGYEAALADELAARSGLVISTGGGMLLAEDVAARLGSTGRVFCLVASPETILARVRADGVADRPLLDTADPAARIRELLAERSARYGTFEQIVTDGRTVDAITADLLARFADRD